MANSGVHGIAAVPGVAVLPGDAVLPDGAALPGDTLLRAAGLRVTAGRLAVLDAIDACPHSDADALFEAVRVLLPATSPQAVYGILGALTAAGIIRRIEPAGSPSRYERRIGDNHHHVVCSSCGAIADVDCVHGEAPCLVPSSTSGFTVQSAEVTFWGMCPACQAMSPVQESVETDAAPAPLPAP